MKIQRGNLFGVNSMKYSGLVHKEAKAPLFLFCSLWICLSEALHWFLFDIYMYLLEYFGCMWLKTKIFKIYANERLIWGTRDSEQMK